MWVVLGIATAAVCEAFLSLAVMADVRRLHGIVNDCLRVLMSKKISDHWKERILPVYAGRMFRKSLSMFLKFSVLLILFVAIVGFYTGDLVAAVSEISRPLHLLATMLFAAAYLTIRAKLVR